LCPWASRRRWACGSVTCGQSAVLITPRSLQYASLRYIEIETYQNVILPLFGIDTSRSKDDTSRDGGGHGRDDGALHDVN
jgi:hypothetical protein